MREEMEKVREGVREKAKESEKKKEGKCGREGLREEKQA